MKKVILQLSFMLISLSGFAQSKPELNLNQVFNPNSKMVLVTAHRGDWRNTPENSIQALKNCIAMGVDIMELDLKKTKDGYLVIMHDRDIDRTTTGKGDVADYTLAEIQKFYLRSGSGHPTKHQIPTFKEILSIAKDHIIIDVDKGYDYYPQVIKELREAGMIRQAIVNVKGSTPLTTIEQEQGKIDDDITIMPIVDMKRPDALQIINSYKPHKRTVLQANFNTDTLAILKHLEAFRSNYGLWINSLWPEQNGGHDDDQAVEENKKDETWGWLVKQKANMIQTDRPKELIEYLKTKKLHL
ncbi:glycerophosphodiester phosphodiesterase family protein [Pedobacter sp. CFBP9032]|uniref:glycerophosphodiester phosphodiesterase family protein n=1 Tax=Pedobacter sp. CFBP9032 TaxID=3096539 RepID=UPI002A6B5736|nr:glycerophosphodiester phosphodiesterase family protein [Pedobacter sp. CFBP9032]MDY0904996.1 glycerophosphodiester phosphodiesterase family protein [Pedobacter sp. CFBP9032]